MTDSRTTDSNHDADHPDAANERTAPLRRSAQTRKSPFSSEENQAAKQPSATRDEVRTPHVGVSRPDRPLPLTATNTHERADLHTPEESPESSDLPGSNVQTLKNTQLARDEATKTQQRVPVPEDEPATGTDVDRKMNLETNATGTPQEQPAEAKKPTRPPGELGGHTVQSWEQDEKPRTPASSASKDSPLPEDGAPGALPARPEDVKSQTQAGGAAERSTLSSTDVGAGPEQAARPGEGNTSENSAGAPSDAVRNGVAQSGTSRPPNQGRAANLPSAIPPDVPRTPPATAAPSRVKTPDPDTVDTTSAASGVATHLPTEMGSTTRVAATPVAPTPQDVAAKGADPTEKMEGGGQNQPNVAMSQAEPEQGLGKSHPVRVRPVPTVPGASNAAGAAKAGPSASVVDAICAELTMLLQRELPGIVAKAAGQTQAPARPPAPDLLKPARAVAQGSTQSPAIPQLPPGKGVRGIEAP